MGKFTRSSEESYGVCFFYRATGKALPGGPEDICNWDRAAYLIDVLSLCRRGIWEQELHQFMPPQSLRVAVAALLELGLIERIEGLQPVPARRPAAKPSGSRRAARSSPMPVYA